MEPISVLGLGLTAGIARSLTGWAEHKLQNSKTDFQTRKLVETILRISIIHIAIYLGATGVGIDAEPMATAAAAFLSDKLFHAIKAM